MRNKSFGQDGVSLVDGIIFYLRSRKIKKHLHNVDSLVDIGCGYNADLLRLIQKKFNIKKCIGADLSVNLDLNTDNFVLQKKNINCEKIDLPDQSVDRVVSLAVLEHLENPENLVSEAFRLLKSNGKLILTTPSIFAKPILEFLGMFGLIDYAEVKDHKNYFNKRQLKAMMIEAGFKKSDIEAKSFLFGLNNIIICTKS
jgi:SAM-dependent methyltransferase